MRVDVHFTLSVKNHADALSLLQVIEDATACGTLSAGQTASLRAALRAAVFVSASAGERQELLAFARTAAA